MTRLLVLLLSPWLKPDPVHHQSYILPERRKPWTVKEVAACVRRIVS